MKRTLIQMLIVTAMAVIVISSGRVEAARASRRSSSNDSETSSKDSSAKKEAVKKAAVKRSSNESTKPKPALSGENAMSTKSTQSTTSTTSTKPKKPESAKREPAKPEDLDKSEETRAKAEAAKSNAPKPAATSETQPSEPPAATAAAVATPAPAARPRPKRATIEGQVFCGEEWRAAEVFVVQPGQTLLMAVTLPAAYAATDLNQLSPVAMSPGNDRRFTIATANEYCWLIPEGLPLRIDQNEVEWMAPASPGSYFVECDVTARNSFTCKTGATSQEKRDAKPLTAKLRFQFLVPYKYDAAASGTVQGYLVGNYMDPYGKDVSSIVRSHREAYRAPEYFVPVTSETARRRVSEHFTLGDFLTIQPSEQTVYFPYNDALVRAMEGIYAGLESQGVLEPRIRIQRAFISPAQVEQLKSQGIKLLSRNRYQYGDALIFLVDNDNDNKMDDIDRNGKIDADDARKVADVVRDVQKRLNKSGWLGVYVKGTDPGLPESPMVGFDLRGWRVETVEGEGSSAGDE